MYVTAPVALGETTSEQAIPAGSPQKTAATYHEIPIDFDDPRNKEPLVELKKYGIAGEAYYARKDGLNAPYYACICNGEKSLYMRKGAAERLRNVNKVLAALGLELFVHDAYRPVECQRKLWEYSLAEARRHLGEKATNEELVEYASNYCSNPTKYNPDDFKTWPTHLSGGAVDLTLRRKGGGEFMYMGSIYDDDTALSETSFFEAPEQNKPDKISSSQIDAKRNRRILYWAMTKEGFVNYPHEWWHYDFGTQLAVQNNRSGSPIRAFYGRI